METVEKKEKNIHHGHNVRKLREASGMSQLELSEKAFMSQQTVSRYERSALIEDDILNKFAKALDVPVTMLKGMAEDAVTFIVKNNTFGDYSIGCNYVNEDNSTKTYNPLDKIIELSDEKTELYERMLELEREHGKVLETLLNRLK